MIISYLQRVKSLNTLSQLSKLFDRKKVYSRAKSISPSEMEASIVKSNMGYVLSSLKFKGCLVSEIILSAALSLPNQAKPSLIN